MDICTILRCGTFHEFPIIVILFGVILFLLAMICGTFMPPYTRTKKYLII